MLWWCELLKEHYHSPRHLISLHLNQVLDFASISCSSPKLIICSFINTLTEITQALKALCCEITITLLLSTILIQKTDNELRKCSENYQPTHEAHSDTTPHTLPDVQEVIKFLNEEYAHAEDANLDNTPYHSKASFCSFSQPSKQKSLKKVYLNPQMF